LSAGFHLRDRLFVLTGAGISADSGLATFRGSGGLWNGHRVEEVATPEAWLRDPELVWRFYSMRRRDAMTAEPNAGHLALATLEQSMGSGFICARRMWMICMSAQAPAAFTTCMEPCFNHDA
jgi:NAD-dependent deacetylase